MSRNARADGPERQDDKFRVTRRAQAARGSNPLIPAVENGLFPLMEELGHRVIIQTVIAGGQDAEETIKGTMALLEATTMPLVLTIAMVVWVQIIGR
jgi:hypothetical protein